VKPIRRVQSWNKVSPEQEEGQQSFISPSRHKMAPYLTVYFNKTETISAEVSATASASIVTDPYYSSVVLLAHMNGTNGSTNFVDSSISPKTITTNGNAQISTTQFKWSGSSGYFDGSNDCLTIPYDSGFNFGSGNFTIEFWIYKIGNNVNTSRIWNANGDFYHQIEIAIDASGYLSSYGTTNGTTWNAWSNATIALLSNNIWYHVAFVRNGGSIHAYINGSGVLLTSALGASTLVNGTSGGTTRSIGGQTVGTDRPLNGYLDDFRITKGIARYTSNFSVPTEQFPDQ